MKKTSTTFSIISTLAILVLALSFPSSSKAVTVTEMNDFIKKVNYESNSKIIIDNADTSFVKRSGIWQAASGYEYATYAGSVKSFTFYPKPFFTGPYKVYMQWPARSDASSATKISIRHATGSVGKTINQKLNAGTWFYIGSYTFNKDTATNTSVASIKLEVNASTTGAVLADKVKLEWAGDPSVLAFADTSKTANVGITPANTGLVANMAQLGDFIGKLMYGFFNIFTLYK
jgi:hypothetical protein